MLYLSLVSYGNCEDVFSVGFLGTMHLLHQYVFVGMRMFTYEFLQLTQITTILFEKPNLCNANMLKSQQKNRSNNQNTKN